MAQVFFKENDPPSIEATSASLSNNKVAILPTETVYALTCDAKSRSAIAKIQNLKGRGANKPFSVFVPDISFFEQFNLGNAGRKIVKSFMPGPLTLIISISAKQKESLGFNDACFSKSDDGYKLAIRIPDYAFFQSLFEIHKAPLIATSVNRSGEAAALALSEMSNEIIEGVDLVVEGKNCSTFGASTIIDLSSQPPFFNIIRQGSITSKIIQKKLNSKTL